MKGIWLPGKQGRIERGWLGGQEVKEAFKKWRRKIAKRLGGGKGKDRLVTGVFILRQNLDPILPSPFYFVRFSKKLQYANQLFDTFHLFLIARARLPMSLLKVGLDHLGFSAPRPSIKRSTNRTVREQERERERVIERER